ncbi:hypothetical protein [Rhizobium multihospitium]|uniref:hypothetical protein n=1 Tax=Rhizobium multihospitium TaxID=410764 RepID=UPI000B88F389|nr:hypothetical protein [Rhizobium multihospitium]
MDGWVRGGAGALSPALDGYRRRLVSHQSRQGGVFGFADELAEKRKTLRDVEEALATSAREDARTDKIAA